MDSTSLTKLRWSKFVLEYTALNVSLANGSQVPVFSMDISALTEYCDQEKVQKFAQIINEIAHSHGKTSTLPTQIEGYKFLIATLLLTVGLCGLLGNIFTAAVIYLTPLLHSTTNCLLANLAISDFLLICCGVPYDLYYLLFSSDSIMFEGYCELTSTTISWFTFASILTIMAISFERLIGICYPLSVKLYFHPLSTNYLMLTIWIVSFLPSIFMGLQFKPVVRDFCGNKQQVGGLVGTCDYVGWLWIQTSYVFEVIMVLTFVLPVLFIVFCYMKILSTLNQVNTMSRDASLRKHSIGSRRESDQSITQSGQLSNHCRASGGFKSEKAQRSVIRMLLTVTAVFILCYLPYHIERLLVHHHAQCGVCVLLYPISGVLQYFSAALNPCIYTVMSHRFRKAFKEVLGKKVVSGEAFKKVSLLSANPVSKL